VALGQQGWQASLDWHQSGDVSALHLAGPFGVGGLAITMTPAGLSLNGAPPSADVTEKLQARLGFELPLDNLKFWLLGIPNPAAPFDLTRNAQDRAQHLAQAGWSIDYDQYRPDKGDVLPVRLVLSRADARVRIVVDRWQMPR
jgi:outer membrane lipoprotein LolB